MPTNAYEIRLGIATFLIQSFGIGAYTIAAATGAPYPRLLGLRAAAEHALGRNQLDDAASLSAELPDPGRAIQRRLVLRQTRFTMDAWCSAKSPWHAVISPARRLNCSPQATPEDRLRQAVPQTVVT